MLQRLASGGAPIASCTLSHGTYLIVSVEIWGLGALMSSCLEKSERSATGCYCIFVPNQSLIRVARNSYSMANADCDWRLAMAFRPRSPKSHLYMYIYFFMTVYYLYFNCRLLPDDDLLDSTRITHTLVTYTCQVFRKSPKERRARGAAAPCYEQYVVRSN